MKPPLDRIAAAHELEIAVLHGDGRVGRWTPIWVVVVEEQVLVRTWHRRDTGWYGAALRSGRARIRVPGAALEVRVAADGDRARAAVDAGYVAKYGAAGAASMTTDEAAASTLRLVPEG